MNTHHKTKTEKMRRPPIIVVVGHIDHGKTTILDAIRKTKIAEKESGGITQHIGAYEIEHKGKKITFIDTPGHEAFSKMRSRGVVAADIGILVVAADEGVKPQTKEAIKILADANLPFLVAINKIDKPGADTNRVKKELAQENVLVEGWGGKTPVIEISAKQGKNLDELLELILLMAEVEELSADDGPASGVVIESHRDAARGNTATLLLLNGHTKKGSFLVFGNSIEGIKILENFLGAAIDDAHYSMPVRISSLSSLPDVGETFNTFGTKKEAETYVEENKREEKQKNVFPAGTEAKPVLYIIVKADVSGSREAIEGLIEKLRYPEADAVILKSEVGDINESDLKTARVKTPTVIAAFKVKVPGSLQESIERFGILILQHDVIYDLFEAIKKELSRIIPPEIVRTNTGQAKILALFKKQNDRQVVGGKVTSGKILKGAQCEISREKEVIGRGKIKELQHLKQNTDEVKEGLEFGMMIETPVEIKIGDVFTVFQEEKKYKKI